MCILFAFIFTFVLVDSTTFLVNLTSVATFAILDNLRRQSGIEETSAKTIIHVQSLGQLTYNLSFISYRFTSEHCQ